jgi:hypothetical protein
MTSLGIEPSTRRVSVCRSTGELGRLVVTPNVHRGLEVGLPAGGREYIELAVGTKTQPAVRLQRNGCTAGFARGPVLGEMEIGGDRTHLLVTTAERGGLRKERGSNSQGP